MSPTNPGSSSTEPQKVAAYIAAMAAELATLAKSQRLDALGRILDMARMEADQIARGYGVAENEIT
jgi:hypothetical protein